MTEGQRRRRRNRRHRKVSGERVDLWKIAERDRCKCHLCGYHIDMTLAGTNDEWAPSLDHMVPLCVGGTDTSDNVSLAHRRCNSCRDNVPLWLAREVLPYVVGVYRLSWKG